MKRPHGGVDLLPKVKASRFFAHFIFEGPPSDLGWDLSSPEWALWDLGLAITYIPGMDPPKLINFFSLNVDSERLQLLKVNIENGPLDRRKRWNLTLSHPVAATGWEPELFSRYSIWCATGIKSETRIDVSLAKLLSRTGALLVDVDKDAAAAITPGTVADHSERTALQTSPSVARVRKRATCIR